MATFIGPQNRVLADGRRHFNNGPIDLILECMGDQVEVDRAYAQAEIAFESVLDNLVNELTMLRAPVTSSTQGFKGAVATRMLAAVRPYNDIFVTPMAAVAGSVSDYILMAMLEGRDINKAYVNNGGDIAVHVAEQESFRTGIVFDVNSPVVDGITVIDSDSQVRGIATSGWSGRSLSLGIADSVTVLASNSASADVAATLIGNATNIDHPNIQRVSANEINIDSDLKNALVTLDVGYLSPVAIKEALDRGEILASQMLKANLIKGVLISVKGVIRTVGEPVLTQSVSKQ